MLSVRKRRARLREASPGFGLSFVDMVSGGFGAAFFLFLIFASLPVDSPALSAGGGARFLEVQVHWEAGPRRVEVYLDVDGSAPPIRLSSGWFDVDVNTGILSHRSGPRPFWRTATASGFSWFGQGSMEEKGPGNRNALRFRLIDPCGVTLRIGAAVHGTSRGLDWLESVPQPDITAALVIVQSGENGAREVYEGTIDLRNSATYPATLTSNGQTLSPALDIPPPNTEAPWCDP